MKIICGLGNPGSEYQAHRHNIGFRVVDAVAARCQTPLSGQKFSAHMAQASIAGEKVLLLKPQTFMNLSGTSLAAAARFYKVAPAEVLVVHDELDLPFGTLQLKAGGGTGGHNGLNSIVESWGETGFARLRFGIGRPVGVSKDRVVGHVLQDFSHEEACALLPLIDRSCEAVACWAKEGLQKAMNAFNRRARTSPTEH